MAKQKSKEAGADDIRIVCRNRRAAHEYEILDTLECGLVLTGTEVKSLRENQAMIEDAYVSVTDNEVWLIGSDIPEYTKGNRLNHKPRRDRKLLLHKREISKFCGKAEQKGFTLIPLKLYFKSGRAKIEIAVARGRQLHDKRAAKKDAEVTRDIRREMANRRKD